MSDSTAERNVELARRGFEAYNAGDAETVAKLMRPDVEVHAAPGLVNSGDYRGQEGYTQWNAEWTEAWDEFKVEPTAVEPIGDRHVVVDAHQVARGAGSGIDVEMDVFWAFEVDGGQVARMHLYPTREEALEVIEGWRGGDSK